MQLTALDYLEIQQLVTRYAFALDSGADNGRMFAALYSKDGGFVRTTGEVLRTPEALADAARRGTKGPMSISHFIMNHVIEPTADGAIGKQYAAIFDIGNNNGPSSLRAGGTYEDVYVKTPRVGASNGASTRRTSGGRCRPTVVPPSTCPFAWPGRRVSRPPPRRCHPRTTSSCNS
jgi:hypothetical protein